MHKRKSQRHANAANARWRNAEAAAQAERDAGIPDREPMPPRPAWELDLRAVGGPWWRCEPCAGYIADRVYDQATGEPVMRAPPKTILNAAVRATPRRMGERAAQ